MQINGGDGAQRGVVGRKFNHPLRYANSATTLIMSPPLVYATLYWALETMVAHWSGAGSPGAAHNDPSSDLELFGSTLSGCDPPAALISHKSPPQTHNRFAASLRWFGPIAVVQAIRLVRLDAPERIQAGEPLKIRCLYETKGDKLQSLSWYKNGREFYRYQPFERRQPVLIFNLTGIHVDLSRSRNSTVYLTNTTIETSGRYKCEATATTFQEVNMDAYVNVEIKANSGPRLIELDLRLVFLSIIVMFI